MNRINSKTIIRVSKRLTHYKIKRPLSVFEEVDELALIQGEQLPKTQCILLKPIRTNAKKLTATLEDCISLEDWLRKPIDAFSFVCYLYRLCTLLWQWQQQQVNRQCVILLWDSVFMSCETHEPLLVYAPLTTNEPQLTTSDFFQHIVYRAQFVQNEHLSYSDAYITLLRNTPRITESLERLRDALIDIVMKPQPQKHRGEQQATLLCMSQSACSIPLYAEEGVVLGTDPVTAHHIANPLLSRHHVHIVCHNQLCFVTDLGSLNGSYINDTPLPAHHTYRLQEHDLLRLADMTFLFQSNKKEEILH